MLIVGNKGGRKRNGTFTTRIKGITIEIGRKCISPESRRIWGEVLYKMRNEWMKRDEKDLIPLGKKQNKRGYTPWELDWEIKRVP